MSQKINISEPSSARGDPLTADEQMQTVGDLLKSGDLVVMVVENEKGETTVGVNAMYEDPAAFGVLVADMISYIIGAYATAGYSHKAVRETLLAALGDELDFPTYTPNVIHEARRDRPKG
jgi:hypothetical protein